MLVAAALVPESALLVPGGAGRATVLEVERQACLEAIGALTAARPAQVVVVSPRRHGGGLAAAGIDPSIAAEGLGAPGAAPVALGSGGDVGTAVASWGLARVGWRGPVELAPPLEGDAAALAGLGRRLAGRPDPDPAARTALLLVGSLSARRGPRAPLPEDPRAPGTDVRLAADLVTLDGPARARLAAVPAEEATALAVSAWAPWQVLLGAVGDAPWRGRLHLDAAPWGAGYLVVDWTPGGGTGAP
ncbi:hypothetical protein J4G33_15940 [Actinotalea sp. BY-33]|uniref:Uncharacterized protein n=1 Tax=Actinotalea soli TaxID=2819234 RepID=A0A939LV63_9CELL|nr:hypothetical protein [Actinotalea soli]MBO1753300.1 hypothetical protein [Actinotalea soli]